MSSITSGQFRFLRGAGYFAAIATIITQIIDLILRSWPVRVHSEAWRISFIGSTAGVLLTLLLMVFVVLAIASYSGDSTVALVMSALSVLAALVCFAMIGMFALDAIQMRNQVRMSLARQFDMTSAWILVRELVGVVGFAMLAIGGLRSARAAQRLAPRQTPKSNLIAGTTRPSAVASGTKPLG